MNILFLTMSKFRDINESGIYTDLMRCFRKDGHKVYVVTPTERRDGKSTYVTETDGVHILNVRTLNVQKTNVIEKGIGQVLLEPLYQRAIKAYFKDVRFDIVLYSTPPITFNSVIKNVKRQNPRAITYLMLKDIFPQNAVDIGMLKTTGVKGFLFRAFRKKEKELYRISDFIGCMSPANVQYVLEHNPEVDAGKVDLCPNSYEAPTEQRMDDMVLKREIREKYHLPIDKPIFLYGGNLGKPQGIPFLIDCLEANKEREDCHFVVVGDGFDYPKIEKWYCENQPKAVSLFKRLPKADYDKLADACDVGLIFLDHRFTIPNFPSRLLPYLMGKKPVIACTDPHCDTGTIAQANGFGLYCESNSVEAFTSAVNAMLLADRDDMGNKAYQFFLDNYTVEHTYNAIMKHF